MQPEISNKNYYWKNKHGCPRLFLAPMEGIGDASFRKAMAIIGGFDEACTEFMRVPINAHVKSLAKKYDPFLTHPYPQAAQIMGSDPDLLAQMSKELELLHAPRVDLNCGCPSNIVVGKGAGSSLLKTPKLLYEIIKTIKSAISIPLSVKLRSGYEDTSLFQENLLACQEAKANFISIHPRTKLEGYRPPADWSLIATAKEILNIPVIGNGDIRTVEDINKMLKETRCDGIMIGRGSLKDPWIFHKAKAFYSKVNFKKDWNRKRQFLETYYHGISDFKDKLKINRLKALLRYLLEEKESLKSFLTNTNSSTDAFLEKAIMEIRKDY